MTLPVPARLHAVDIDRDDGALAAAFDDAEGAYFRLRLPVRAVPDGSAPCGHAAPELERSVPHLYTDKFTGGQHGYETRETVTLSWAEGARLLDQLAPLSPAPDGTLERMRRIVAARGDVAAAP